MNEILGFDVEKSKFIITKHLEEVYISFDELSNLLATSPWIWNSTIAPRDDKEEID